MTYLQSAFLGIIQGLTEYLPISSTAHLRIIPALLGWNDPGAAYTAVIQLGTLLAVFVYFRKDLVALLQGTVRDLSSQKRWGADAMTVSAILAGTLPIGILGYLFKKTIETQFRTLGVIAGALILMGLVLAWAEKVGLRNRLSQSLSFWEIQVIGAAQAIALIPGASRSGTTLAAALFLGLRRDEAARFSFLLGIPAVAAAGLFQFKDLIHAGIDQTGLGLLLVGTVTAFVAGLLAIDGLIRFLKTQSTAVFIVYRIVLGLAIFASIYNAF